MQRERNEVLECIRSTLHVLIDVDVQKVVPEARWEDFGADRFEVFAVLRDVQKQFDVEVPDEDAYEMEKVGDLIRFVETAS